MRGSTACCFVAMAMSLFAARGTARAAEPGFVRVEAFLRGGKVRVLFTGAQIRPGLILTCAHCCRSAGGRGARVRVHVLDEERWRPHRTVIGTVQCFDSSTDVGLVRLDDPDAVSAVYVLAPRGTTVQPGEGIYAYRWSSDPERLVPVAGKITRVNPYVGAPTLETDTQPQSGESGGPLVLIHRLEIIGVTSAADMTLRRGIYSGLEAIYQLLDTCEPEESAVLQSGHREPRGRGAARRLSQPE